MTGSFVGFKLRYTLTSSSPEHSCHWLKLKEVFFLGTWYTYNNCTWCGLKHDTNTFFPMCVIGNLELLAITNSQSPLYSIILTSFSLFPVICWSSHNRRSHYCCANCFSICCCCKCFSDSTIVEVNVKSLASSSLADASITARDAHPILLFLLHG